MFTKILICSDGSEDARNAALLASEIATHFGSAVIALNVFDLATLGAGVMGVCAVPLTQETIDLCTAGEREAAENAVKPIFTRFELPYKMLQQIGQPVDSIVEVAQEEQADLIVVGSRGLSALKELFLGSVSHGVLHQAHCPVLIDRGKPTPIQRILLASDSSAGAQSAASYAFALAKQFDACLTVLNVVEFPGEFAAVSPNPNPVEAAEEEIHSEQRCKAVKASLQAILAETKIQYNLHQESGSPGKTIVQYAENGGFDLIVLGSRGMGGFESLMMGSVSDYVAHHAHCALLVVR